MLAGELSEAAACMCVRGTHGRESPTTSSRRLREQRVFLSPEGNWALLLNRRVSLDDVGGCAERSGDLNLGRWGGGSGDLFLGILLDLLGDTCKKVCRDPRVRGCGWERADEKEPVPENGDQVN